MRSTPRPFASWPILLPSWLRTMTCAWSSSRELASRRFRRALIWGAVLPLGLVAAGFVHPGLWLAGLVYPLQWARLARRGGGVWAYFTLLGKVAEAQGALGFYLRRGMGRRARIIEYK